MNNKVKANFRVMNKNVSLDSDGIESNQSHRENTICKNLVTVK